MSIFNKFIFFLIISITTGCVEEYVFDYKRHELPDLRYVVVDTDLTVPPRTKAAVEIDISGLLLAAPETDFAFLLKDESGSYQYEKGTKTLSSEENWNSASKMLQALAASYQIKKGVVSASDSVSDIVDAYILAFPASGVVPYTGDATIQDALNFSTGYTTQCRNAGDPSNTNIAQPTSWLQCVSDIPNVETQSSPAGTDGSTEYSTGHQDQYGAPILMELIRTGATYVNAAAATVPFVDWTDVWADFIVNEFPTLVGTQVGTTYFTSSDVIKKCTINQYMAVLEALDDTSTSTVFLNKAIRDAAFVDQIAFRTSPVSGGVNEAFWFNGIDSGWNGLGGWIRPLGDEDAGDVETSGLGGQYTKISRSEGFKLVFGTVSTSGGVNFPGGFTIYTRNSGELRALVLEWAQSDP